MVRPHTPEWDRLHGVRTAPFGLVRNLGYGEHGDPLTPDECENIRSGRCPVPDPVVAGRLLEDVYSAMEAVATRGPRIQLLNDAFVRENAALTASLGRLGIENPNPHRNLWRWKSYYASHLPKWRDRRDYLADLFAPVRDALQIAKDRQQRFEEAIPNEPTGWPEIDAKLTKLRRDFSTAESPEDFQAVGLLCTSTLEALGRLIFDPGRDLRSGSAPPKLNDAKARIEAFVATAARGRKFENVRALIRPALAQAHAVKHSHTADRVHASVAASATALVVGIVRELAADVGASADHRAA